MPELCIKCLSERINMAWEQGYRDRDLELQSVLSTVFREYTCSYSEILMHNILNVCWFLPVCIFVFRLKEGEDQKEINIEPAQALDEVEPLPEDYYTRPINLPEGLFHPFCQNTVCLFCTYSLLNAWTGSCADTEDHKDHRGCWELYNSGLSLAVIKSETLKNVLIFPY